MLYPIIPTLFLLAEHDAKLAEMQKEPAYPVADKSVRIRYQDAWLHETRQEPPYPIFNEPARIHRRRRLVFRLGKWLVSAGLRLQARHGAEVPRAPERSPFPTSS
jgi:hypothetical protein